MPDMRRARTLIDAAEQAASASDYAGAERLLREAVALQEAELGPLDPELANTFNNLGVICEIIDKPADAERFYQCAHEIAASVLAPDHPFVTPSGKSLADFHRAHGRPAAPARADAVVSMDLRPPAAAPVNRSSLPPLPVAALPTPAAPSVA